MFRGEQENVTRAAKSAKKSRYSAATPSLEIDKKVKTTEMALDTWFNSL
jgi:hypothetical protein